jgi:hypothetical protein
MKNFELEGREPNWAEFQDQNPDFKSFDLAFNYASPNSIKILLGADVQHLWMPIERREKWIRARRLLGYQTKLGLAVGGSFLGIRSMSYIQEKQMKDEESRQKTSRPRLMRFQPKNPQEERKKNENPSEASEKFQLPAPAVDELVQWIKTNFKRSEEKLMKKYEEVCQQLIHQVAEVLEKSGFRGKSESPKNVHDKNQFEERFPSSASVRRPGMFRRPSEVSRKRFERLSHPSEGKIFLGMKRRYFPGSSSNPEDQPALSEVRLRRVSSFGVSKHAFKSQVGFPKKISVSRKNQPAGRTPANSSLTV